MKLRSFILFFVIAQLLFPACRNFFPGNIMGIKLSHLFDLRNVELSPFKNPSLDGEKDFVPEDCPPLEKEETGPNPYNLKRRLHIGPISLNIILATPQSRYSWELSLPPRSYLEFGIGLVRDRNFEDLAARHNLNPEGVEFLVRLERAGRTRTVFQDFLRMPEKKESRTVSFEVHRVDLPPEGGRFRLTLETDGEGWPFAFWYSPMVVPRKEEPAGIILISLDTLRADHLGCYGYSRPTSLATDELSREGVLFEQAISTSSWTLPAHVSLLTSSNPARHGVMAADDKMPLTLVTLAEVLSRHGFFCGAITGGGFLSPIYGFGRGFDFYNEAEGSVDYENSAELVLRAAQSWLEDHKEKDFFLFLHTYQVHSPYKSPEPYRHRFLSADALFDEINMERHLGGKGGVFRSLTESERKNIIDLYDNEIKYTDEALVGGLVKWLKEKNLYDRVMIVLTSDHGEEFYEHGAWTHGPHLYQEAIRVPLVIKFPHGEFRGKKVDRIVRLTDISPTILEAAGIKKRLAVWDGASLYSVLKGDETKDRVFLADTCWLSGEVCGEPESGRLPMSVATNVGKNKVIINQDWPDSLSKAYEPGPRAWPSFELYDLDKDKAEVKNLAGEKADLLRETLERIRSYYRQMKKMTLLKVPLTEEQLEKLRALGYIH